MFPFRENFPKWAVPLESVLFLSHYLQISHDLPHYGRKLLQSSGILSWFLWNYWVYSVYFRLDLFGTKHTKPCKCSFSFTFRT